MHVMCSVHTREGVEWVALLLNDNERKTVMWGSTRLHWDATYKWIEACLSGHLISAVLHTCHLLYSRYLVQNYYWALCPAGPGQLDSLGRGVTCDVWQLWQEMVSSSLHLTTAATPSLHYNLLDTHFLKHAFMKKVSLLCFIIIIVIHSTSTGLPQ